MKSVWLALFGLALSAPVHAAQPLVELKTSQGNIVLALDQDKAPKTVANFLRYVKSGHYRGTIFHRVIDGFMIQGGGFDARFNEKETAAPIPNEANNGLKNEVFTVAMARTSDPQSATAQFFINVQNNDFLDYRAPSASGWGYAVFGKVVKGQDVVSRIAQMRTGPGGPFDRDVPKSPVIIEDAKLLPN